MNTRLLLPNMSNPIRMKKRMRKIAWRVALNQPLRPKQGGLYNAMIMAGQA